MLDPRLLRPRDEGAGRAVPSHACGAMGASKVSAHTHGAQLRTACCRKDEHERLRFSHFGASIQTYIFVVRAGRGHGAVSRNGAQSQQHRQGELCNKLEFRSFDLRRENTRGIHEFIRLASPEKTIEAKLFLSMSRSCADLTVPLAPRTLTHIFTQFVLFLDLEIVWTVFLSAFQSIGSFREAESHLMLWNGARLRGRVCGSACRATACRVSPPATHVIRFDCRRKLGLVLQSGGKSVKLGVLPTKEGR